jgi:hypothetical protein
MRLACQFGWRFYILLALRELKMAPDKTRAPEYPEAMRNVFDDFLQRLSSQPDFPAQTVEALRSMLFDTGLIEPAQLRSALETSLRESNDKAENDKDLEASLISVSISTKATTPSAGPTERAKAES